MWLRTNFQDADSNSSEADASSSATASQVFNIVELLEGVLLHVDIKTLLLAQRVSKTWKATIAGSLKLQQTLFFAKINDHGHELKCTLPGSTITCAATGWSACDIEPKMLEIERAGVLLVNPFIYNILREEQRYGDFLFGKDVVDRLHQIDSGCWKSMLLSQPSTPSARIHPSLSVKQSDFPERTTTWHLRSAEVENEEGLTLGDVMKALSVLLEETKQENTNTIDFPDPTQNALKFYINIWRDKVDLQGTS